MDTFDSHRSIIDAWPRLADFADDLGVGYGTAKAMRRRDRIGIEHIAAVVAGAERRGIAGITADLIARIAARRQADAKLDDGSVERAAT